MMKHILILICLALGLYSCSNDPSKDNKSEVVETKNIQDNKKSPEKRVDNQAAIDDQMIQDYIAKKGLEMKRTKSGIYYRLIKEGNSTKKAQANSTVVTNYKGTLLNGKVFDRSPEEKPIEFPLNRVIPGWTEGLQLVGEGGTIDLIIPSGLAYGKAQVSVIPPNSVLRFEVDLLEIK